MTPTTTRTATAVTGTGQGGSTWNEYLDSVEAAVLDVQNSLLEGRPPQMPALSLPAGPPPDHAGPRRAAVAALLAEVTELVGQHRDAVSERLASLPRQNRQSNAYHTADAGERLDVMS